jgi:hypothetical protein
MRATIIATATFTLLSACANPGDCLGGAADFMQGSGGASLFTLPVALVVAGACAGISAAASDADRADAEKLGDTPAADPAPDHGSAR